MKDKILNKIIDKIKSSKSFFITSHINGDGDALGSELAMYILLKKLHKNVIVVNNEIPAQTYKFLPKFNVIKNKIDKKKFDVAIVLDCTDSHRAGKTKEVIDRAEYVINIDHHISNSFFGDINWVKPYIGSTSQIIYNLFEKFGIMDKNVALCLYTGISTDTGNFTYDNTTGNTHKIVSHLMEYKINPSIVYEKMRSTCTPLDLAFIGKTISSLQFDSKGKICWGVLANWEDKDYDLTEVIFSTMRLVKDVEVLLIFKETNDNKVRINLRSTLDVDVNKVAKFFGGGGHKKASGVTIKGSLKSVEKKVIAYIRKNTNVYKNKKMNNSLFKHFKENKYEQI